MFLTLIKYHDLFYQNSVINLLNFKYFFINYFIFIEDLLKVHYLFFWLTLIIIPLVLQKR